MKNILAIGILLAAVFAVTLATTTQQPLIASACCEGSYQSAATHWTMGNDCDEAEADFLDETFAEAVAACQLYPCDVVLPACYFDSGSNMWVVDGKLRWGCETFCVPPGL